MPANPLPDLVAAEYLRYGRQISLPSFGEEGQRRLRGSHVLLVGAGGLGSPAATYLAAAGVGALTIIDFDRVEPSNLHRQPLFGESAIGRSKVEAARARLADLNPHVQLEIVDAKLSSHNALDLVSRCDVVVDGSDNFPTRYLVNDACVLAGRPNVYASVLRFDGQLSVLGAPDGPCYRCLFPEPPPPGTVPSCAEAGVLGVLPGLLGTMQALEAIKLLSGVGSVAVGRLILVDALRLEFRSITVRREPSCPACGTRTLGALVDYEDFCGISAAGASEGADADGRVMPPPGDGGWAGVRELHPAELARRVAEGIRFTLVDVREPWEWKIGHIAGARHIPLGSVTGAVTTLDRGEEIVVYCHHGVRSLAAAGFLAEQGFRRLWNLSGGIDRYAVEVDPSMPRY
ncbi:MAG: molybdenum cofactor biosynthesis protein MoeB [Gemmatimonadota bacterium]